MRTGRNWQALALLDVRVYLIEICALAGTHSFIVKHHFVVYLIEICALAGTMLLAPCGLRVVYLIEICALAGT